MFNAFSNKIIMISKTHLERFQIKKAMSNNLLLYSIIWESRIFILLGRTIAKNQ